MGRWVDVRVKSDLMNEWVNTCYSKYYGQYREINNVLVISCCITNSHKCSSLIQQRHYLIVSMGKNFRRNVTGRSWHRVAQVVAVKKFPSNISSRLHSGCWCLTKLVAEVLSSQTADISTELLEWPPSMATDVSRSECWERQSGGGRRVFYDLVSGAPHHHPDRVLFTRNEPLIPANT